MGFKRSWVQIPPARCILKSQIPSPNIQKLQASISKKGVCSFLKISDWDFLGAWLLGFGDSRMRGPFAASDLQR